ncbi:MAG: hypothetical protein GEU80_02825 [Dehalococcoidia bacterium]|nr:hypothetical protein [Dehalococcoidia bacterium]
MQRHIDFEQVFNFRDLGGYLTSDGRQVRWRRLFRSAELQRMSPEEAQRCRADFGIATVIDLRSEGEANHPRGFGPFIHEGIVRHHFPMGDANSKYAARESGEWIPGYVGMLQQYGPMWAEATRLLAREEAYPALFHCVTGKDRTGVLAALVLGALGVDRDTVIEDYSESQRHMDTLVERLRARGVIRDDEPTNPALGVSPSAMAEMLDVLDAEHGGARGYLRRYGVSDDTFDSMCRLLLDAPA